jgi:AdoMet-dependent heme synthase
MSDSSAAPAIGLEHLDHLWFQIVGTVCNFTCLHCFISCSPKNHTFDLMTVDDVRRRLEESVPLGVKEYYFTGGEPFLHPQMTEILIETLRYGPATVLTNASVFKTDWLERLAKAEASSQFTLEFRVSLDGFTPETNDPIRGAGTFARTMRGIQQLADHGFLPIITAARTWPDEQERAVVDGFVRMLRAAGYTRPRLKILPMQDYDRGQLVCSHSRIVTDRGVHVCPILIEAPDSLLAGTLHEAQRPFVLQHGACFTCYQYGAICTNPSATTNPH